MYSTVLGFAFLAIIASAIDDPQECCPNGACYNTGPPWQSPTRSELPPNCAADPPRYFLNTRSNPVYPYVFNNENMSSILGYHDPEKPTVIVIHGFKGSIGSPYVRNITTVYLTRIDCNAYFVDYDNVSSNTNYPQVVSDLRVVATYVIEMVQNLIDNGTNSAHIHLVGFSLGAHLAAYVAKDIQGIGRITGLDPAGPYFTGQSCEVRLCEADAIFTEAIHTNGDPETGLGTSESDAQVNFWVNGGWDQPNCGYVANPRAFLQVGSTPVSDVEAEALACSHFRSVLYYTESIASDCVFWGVKPDNDSLCIGRFTDGYAAKYVVQAKACTPATCAPMDLDTINAAVRGDLVVATNNNSPYCIQVS